MERKKERKTDRRKSVGEMDGRGEIERDRVRRERKKKIWMRRRTRERERKKRLIGGRTRERETGGTERKKGKKMYKIEGEKMDKTKNDRRERRWKVVKK